MSRRSISKRRYPKPDATYNSTLVSLLVSRILKSGKKTLSNSIIAETFALIQERTDTDPVQIFETFSCSRNVCNPLLDLVWFV